MENDRGFFECTPQEREEYRAHLEYVSSINIHDGDYTFRWEDEDDGKEELLEEETTDLKEDYTIEKNDTIGDGSEFIGWGDV